MVSKHSTEVVVEVVDLAGNKQWPTLVAVY